MKKKITEKDYDAKTTIATLTFAVIVVCVAVLLVITDVLEPVYLFIGIAGVMLLFIIGLTICTLNIDIIPNEETQVEPVVKESLDTVKEATGEISIKEIVEETPFKEVVVEEVCTPAEEEEEEIIEKPDDDVPSNSTTEAPIEEETATTETLVETVEPKKTHKKMVKTKAREKLKKTKKERVVEEQNG